ncbi:extracellular serine-rich protein [Xylariales sp. PMI_506]|nr:extracellular serine-rich protein [Xylariales sp. PMI_506]
MKTASALILAVAASVASAAPTTTSTTGSKLPSRTVQETGVTHSVVAGRGGLRFDPDNVVAAVGDVVEWHFTAKNHSVAQSSFGEPCVPLADGTGFFSGFDFAVTEGQADDVFQILVEDDSKPIWYYCAQTVGAHCQNGMVGVINQNFNSPNTLAAFTNLAAGTGASIIPPIVQGGQVIANPNPLSGF